MTRQTVLPSSFTSTQVGIGRHCILELYDCPSYLLDNQSLIQQALREAAEIAKSTLLGELSHKFDPQGVTALVLLAESHISIHTWPESGYAAVDVFTCGAHTLPEAACDYIAKTLQSGRYELQTLSRSGPPSYIPESLMSLAI